MFGQKNGTGNSDSARKPADSRTSPKYNFRHVRMFFETFYLPVQREYRWVTLNTN